MRKIKVAAIQPGYLPTPPEYDCMGGDYRNHASEIVHRFVRRQLEVSFALIEQAGREGCGIVTTSEDSTAIGSFSVDTTLNNIFPDLVELSVPLAEEGFSSLARRYSMYVAACYYKKSEGRIFNTVSLFDRHGNIVFEYRKTHLPAYEKWQVTQGESLGSFETNFGKIGFCICYDMMYPECVQAVALSGAEIIFHPTAGYGWYDSIGEATLRTRANDNSVILVTAKNWVSNAAGKSSVIDYWGQVLVDGGFCRDVVVATEIDLDVPKTQPDWHYPTQTSGIAGLRERSLRERRPELYGRLTEETHERLPVFTVEEQASVIERIKKKECRW